MTHSPRLPSFHLSPPRGRLNDPNGLIRHDGRWHAFYQLDPDFPRLPKRTGWGHAVSDDLLTWTHRPQALFPDQNYDSNGCYSGCALPTPDGVELFYTGNVKDAEGTRAAHQCLATGLEHPTKSPLNPLIATPAPGHTAHFRDPHVTEVSPGRWRMLIGAQTTAGTGGIVMYESSDRRDWGKGRPLRFEGPIPGGHMWECPNLLRLVDDEDGQTYDVLIICPQGIRRDEGDIWRNRYQCGYLVGHLADDVFTVTTPFTELDHGFEFYAPQIFAGTDRAIMLGWLGNPEEDDHPTLEEGWVHCLSAPRELSLRRGHLHQTLITPGDLPEQGPAARVVIEPGQQVLLRDPDDPANTVTVTLSDTTLEVTRDCPLVDNPFGDTRRTTLRHPSAASVMVDHSVVEVQTLDGRAVFSLRTFTHGQPWNILCQTMDTTGDPT